MGMDRLVGMDASFGNESVLVQHSMTILSGGGGSSSGDESSDRDGPSGGDGSQL